MRIYGCILFEYGFLRDLFTLHRISEPSVKVIIPAICRRNLRQRSVLLHNYIQRITGSACRVKGHQEAPVLPYENRITVVDISAVLRIAGHIGITVQLADEGIRLHLLRSTHLGTIRLISR